MRVNAAGRRQGVKGLRDEGIQVETLREVEGGRWEGFWILDFGLAEEIGSRQGRKGRKGLFFVR